MSKRNKFRKAVQDAKKKNQMDEEKAKVQEMQSANDANPTPPDDGVEGSKPVPVVPSAPPDSPQNGTGQMTAEQKEEFEKQLNKLKELLGQIEDLIPNDKNHIVDFSLEANRKAFAAAFSPVLIELLHNLLIERRNEIEEGIEAKRVEVELQGKTIVFENESLPWFMERYVQICNYFDKIKESREEWLGYIKTFNENQAEIQKDRQEEYKKATTAYKTLENSIKMYVDQAIDGRKHPLPPPVRPTGDDVGQQFYYLLIVLPLYKIRCFLTDRYTLAFFHTAILSVLVVLFTLVCFLAHDRTKFHVEAQKYWQIRAWSYVDSTDIHGKCMYLDALYENQKMNAERIERDKAFINKKIRDKNERK